MKSLVVLSGGQDSVTCLALAVKRHGPENVHAITFNYGQRHAREIQAAGDVVRLLGIAGWEVVHLGDDILKGTSPLTDKSQELELYEDHDSMAETIGDRVEKTFVPMRNALFLTLAANRAVVLGCDEIVTGVCQADNANYPDCREHFILSQQDTINEALGRVSSPSILQISTPLMFLTKDQSIHKLLNMGGPTLFAMLAFSHTAYDGQYPPVGKDHASTLRAEGFRVSGWPDPLVIRAWSEGLMGLPETTNYANPTVNDALKSIIDDLKRDLVRGQGAKYLESKSLTGVEA